jgi:hypothetical protein
MEFSNKILSHTGSISDRFAHNRHFFVKNTIIEVISLVQLPENIDIVNVMLKMEVLAKKG